MFDVALSFALHNNLTPIFKEVSTTATTHWDALNLTIGEVAVKEHEHDMNPSMSESDNHADTHVFGKNFCMY